MPLVRVYSSLSEPYEDSTSVNVELAKCFGRLWSSISPIGGEQIINRVFKDLCDGEAT